MIYEIEPAGAFDEGTEIVVVTVEAADVTVVLPPGIDMVIVTAPP